MFNELYQKTYTAAPPTLDTVVKNDKVASGLGWMVIILGVIFIVAIIYAVAKLVPIAHGFMNKSSHKAEEAKDASVNYVIGLLVLLIGPVIVTAVFGFTMGDTIMNAVNTALTGLFK
ncbi:hypothetical protein RyT2_14170 [Pseudolactococcus yaeyamensis]